MTARVDLVLATTGQVVANVDPRYQSYNIEMVEVTGGEFWKPYDAGRGRVIRPPIDLTSTRLRNLARGLGPAYIRVSGTWANWTYFDVDGSAAGPTPDGFDGVLTPEQWLAVGAFARAVDGEIVTSFAACDGARDTTGAWHDDQARALLEFSRANDVPVVAAEFFNEPSLPIGVPKNYDAAAYRRDFTRFVAMAREVAPELRIVGPGGIADTAPLVLSASISPTDLLDASAGALEVFSYHFYPKVSERCGSTEGPEIALNAEFLSRLNAVNVFFEDLRDRYVPGAPMWITETAQAACGGDRWAAHFRDVFRYVDTLGKLAGGDGNVVFHNTLAASDYGLLDEDGFEPRPNYWAAVLWQRVMGTEVLAVDAPAIPNFAVYAHRTPGTAAGVSYAIVNSSETDERVVTTRSGECQMFLLTAESLDSSTVSLNGVPLTTAADGTLPSLNAATVRGTVNVPPASIAFVVEPADERRPNDSRPVR